MTEKQKAKKSLIVQQSYEYLLHSGVDNFSLNKLLESIPMSKGNFYHYFKNKDELFFTVLNKKYEDIYMELAMYLPNETFLEKLENIFFIYVIKNKKIDEYLHLINQMYPLFLDKNNSYLNSYIVDYYDSMNKLVSQFLDEEIKNGSIKEDILKIKNTIVPIADGMFTQSVCTNNFNLQNELKNYFKILDEMYKNNQ